MYNNDMSFKGLNLSSLMLESLSRQGYKDASLGQVKSLSIIKKGENLLYKGPTGSGKTLAYLIPILEIMHSKEGSFNVLIISPTLELNRQIVSVFQEFILDFNFVNITNLDFKKVDSFKRIEDKHIYVGTLGNVHKFLTDNKINKFDFLVLDEADLLFDEDHFLTLNAIINYTKFNQVATFSATLKNDLKNRLKAIINGSLSLYEEKEVTSKSVKHIALNIKFVDVIKAIEVVLEIEKPYLAIVFASSKEGAKTVHDKLQEVGRGSLLISSANTKLERKNIFKELEENKMNLIVATDVFARGIDLIDCDLVISLSLPKNLSFYYHRAGRAGRYNREGKSIIFFNEDTRNDIKRILEKEVLIKEYNLDIKNLKYKDTRSKTVTKRVDKALQSELSKINAEYSTKKRSKVKPNYKKKKQQALAKAEWYYKTRKRKQIIKQSKKKNEVNGK